MNKIIMMGRLTRDPEIRYGGVNNDKAVARYTIAVDRRFKQEGQPQADFFNVVSFGLARWSAGSVAGPDCIGKNSSFTYDLPATLLDHVGR